MRRVLVALALLLFGGSAQASTCGNVPWTFVNGTVADANQVNLNFSTIYSCANNLLASIASIAGQVKQVDTNSDLAAASTLTYPNGVWRKCYSASACADPLFYVPLTSNCAANGLVNDGGSCVNDNHGNAWKAKFPTAGADFRQWGAQSGTNVDTALAAAIAWGCSVHGVVLIPFPPSPYLLNSQVTIGDGTSSTLSTCFGVTLRVVQPYLEDTSLTTPPAYLPFKWNGSSGATAFWVKGYAQSVNLPGIGIDCDGLCATGFRFTNVLGGDQGWLTVWRQIGKAFIVDSWPSNPFSGGNEVNHYHDWVADLPSTGGGGLKIGADDCGGGDCDSSLATIDNSFERMVLNYDATTSGTCGVEIRFATQIDMKRIVATGVGAGVSGKPLCVTPPSGTNGNHFPTDIKIDHPIMQAVAGSALQDTGGWAPSVGGIELAHWSRSYTAFPASTTFGTVWGTDSRGNFYPAPVTSNPVDASGASLTITGYNTVKQVGGQCVLEFDYTYPVTADGSVAAVTIPARCTPVATSSSVAGAPAVYTDLTTAVSLLCGASVTTCNFYNSLTGTAYTNATLSGKNIRGSATFLSAAN